VRAHLFIVRCHSALIIDPYFLDLSDSLYEPDFCAKQNEKYPDSGEDRYDEQAGQDSVPGVAASFRIGQRIATRGLPDWFLPGEQPAS